MSDDAREITLSGSAEIVCDYLEVAVNAIMFQRGVHAAKSFKLQDFCNVDIFMLIGDAGFQMKETVRSLKVAIAQGSVKKVFLNLKAKRTGETIERWNFKINSRRDVKRDGGDKFHFTRKQVKAVKMEIGDVLRQILASVSILPRLNGDVHCTIGIRQNGSGPLPNNFHRMRKADDVIQNVRKIRLRSFATNWHEVKTTIDYKSPSSLPDFY